MYWLSTALLVLGGFICCLNFYLSYIKYPFYKLRGGKKGNYKWISGVPLAGSLLVAVAMIGFRDNTWVLWVAAVLILIDTGGIHWFVGTMLYHAVLKKG